MTKRESTHILSQFINDGFVLEFTEQSLSEFVFDLTGLELENYETLGKSNGKRLTAFLMQEPNHVDVVIEALYKHKESTV